MDNAAQNSGRLSQGSVNDEQASTVRGSHGAGEGGGSCGTVQQATSGLGVAQSRYQAGVGTQLEILDAQLLLVQAESDLAVAQRDRALAIVRT